MRRSPTSRPSAPAGRAGRGVTLAELLVVVAIVALAVVVAVPLISESVRSARIRSSAEQLAVTLRAVRMIAVARQEPRELRVRTDPHNDYRYVDSAGVTRVTTMPDAVRIVAFEMPPGTASTAPVRFRANGSVAGGASSLTRLEALMSRGRVEVWEVSTNAVGLSRARRTSP